MTGLLWLWGGLVSVLLVGVELGLLLSLLFRLLFLTRMW